MSTYPDFSKYKPGSLDHICASVVEFRNTKIVNRSFESEVRHLAEEVIELAMSERDERINEAADVILTAMCAVDYDLDGLQEAMFRKMDLNLISDWVEIRPGQYKRVKGSERH